MNHRRKENQWFKDKYLMISMLITQDYNYVYNCVNIKEVRDTLEMVYKVSIEINRERVNTLV